MRLLCESIQVARDAFSRPCPKARHLQDSLTVDHLAVSHELAQLGRSVRLVAMGRSLGEASSNQHPSVLFSFPLFSFSFSFSFLSLIFGWSATAHLSLSCG